MSGRAEQKRRARHVSVLKARAESAETELDAARGKMSWAVKKLDAYFAGGPMDTVQLHAIMETLRQVLAASSVQEPAAPQPEEETR